MSHMRIRAGLTGQEARDVLGFLQRGNSPAPAPVSQAPGPAVHLAASAMSGTALFDSTCDACHGADGKGTIPGVPDLTAARGRLAQPDSVLRMHVLNGFQTPGSAMAMPPKGGNPSLSDADVAKLVRVHEVDLQTLEGPSSSSTAEDRPPDTVLRARLRDSMIDADRCEKVCTAAGSVKSSAGT